MMPMMLRSSHASRVLQAAGVFTAGFVVGAVLVGGALDTARSALRWQAPVAQAADDRCRSGDAVSGFVCRNFWLSNTRYAVR